MMELWVIMTHASEWDFMQAQGRLLGGYYTDIESVCRILKDQVLLPADAVKSIEYCNDGDKALIVSVSGRLFGAYKDRVPMREDMPLYTD